jgi:hypothetical protein
VPARAWCCETLAAKQHGRGGACIKLRVEAGWLVRACVWLVQSLVWVTWACLWCNEATLWLSCCVVKAVEGKVPGHNHVLSNAWVSAHMAALHVSCLQSHCFHRPPHHYQMGKSTRSSPLICRRRFSISYATGICRQGQGVRSSILPHL